METQDRAVGTEAEYTATTLGELTDVLSEIEAEHGTDTELVVPGSLPDEPLQLSVRETDDSTVISF